MTRLFDRFVQDMQLRNFSESTIRSYTYALKQLSAHFNKEPELINEQEIKDYFLYNRNVKHWSRAAFSVSISAIKFFFEKTLQRKWQVFGLVRPPRDKSLPVILNLKEVNKIFSCIKMEHHKACLKNHLSLGLRIQEGTRLKVADIDSERMFVHIHKGKGAKDRYIPLPNATVDLLRKFWKTHRNPLLLFPAPGRGGKQMPTTDKPIPVSSIQIAFKEACQKANIHKNVSVHHLRHSYAVHLLEAGVDFRYVQQYLGHEDPKTTLIYTRLINIALPDPIEAINKVMDAIR